MFANRRSLLFEKLPFLNIAFLTCCLFVVGHVSSMTLNRQGRQFQQQNDKQLQLSEIMLNEAESEMLQNDMELVPDIDGNSDMYLLVPAAVTNQEQNLQSLTEQSDSQNSENVESNSDMLMQESEGVPTVQVLKLPVDKLETKLDEALIGNNELDHKSESYNNEISESTINTIAEAAQEIEDEIEHELINSEVISKEDLYDEDNANEEEDIRPNNELPVEHKDSETESASSSIKESISENENTQQEMIGTIMEQNASKLEAEKIYEGLTNSAMQSQENANKIEKSEPGDVFQAVEEPNEKESLVNETIKQVSAIIKEYENKKSDESYTPILIDEKKVETSESVNDETEIEKEVEMENQAQVEQTQPDQFIYQTENTEQTSNIEEFERQGELNEAEEIREETTPIEEAEIQEINDKTQTYSPENEAAEEVQLPESELENMEPIKTESLIESEIADKIEPAKEIETIKELFNVEDEEEEIESNNKIQSVEQQTTDSISLSSDDDSQTINELNKVDKEAISVEEPVKSEETQQQQANEMISTGTNQEIQPAEEFQQYIEVEGDEGKEKQVEDIPQNVEKTETMEQETAIGNEDLIADEYQNAEFTQSNEEPLKDVPEVEETQTAEEGNNVVENLQTAEETQSFEEIPVSPEMHSAEQVQFVEEAEVDFKSTEGTNIDDALVEIIQPADEESLTENLNNFPATKPIETAAEVLKPVEEVPLPVNESHIADGTQLIVPTVEETKADEITHPLINQTENQETITVEDKPVEISTDNVTSEESKVEHEEETIDQSNVNQSENLHEISPDIQKPLEDNENDKISESEPIRENTSMLTTIVQVPTKEELTQQQMESEQELQQQPVVVGSIVRSTTLKPLHVLDSAHNYHNTSFMNQMNNDQNTATKEETKKDEQIFSSQLRRYDGAQVWRIVVQNERERKLADELQTKFDGQLWKEVKQEVDYLLKPQVLAEAEHHVRGANLSRIVLIDNLQKVIEVENPSPEKILQLQNRKGYRLSWEAYHRLEDIHGFFDYLAKTYPDICSLEIIGYSIEKRPLKILKISNGNANNSGIWIDGGMHAREWISPAVVTYIANQIAENWEELPAYMRNINWYVHAVANPDGYEYSHTTDRLWRKNMRSHGRACPGVDLNRNFGYKWGGKGTSANPCSQTYRGNKAFSEPETFYISKFISNFPRDTFKAYLSFHSYGQYILYPWGYDYLITNDMADLDLVARQAGTIITKSTGAKFTVGSSANTLYPAAGGSDDWAKGIAGIKYSYTIEMGDTGRYGFVLPAEYIAPNGKNGVTFVQSVAKAITMGKNGRRRKLKLHKTH